MTPYNYSLLNISLPSSSLRFAEDETLTTGLVLIGFSDCTPFAPSVGDVAREGLVPVFNGIMPGCVKFSVAVVNLRVVGAWVEFNTTGLLEVLVVLVSWPPIPLPDVGFDALLNETEELLPARKEISLS